LENISVYQNNINQFFRVALSGTLYGIIVLLMLLYFVAALPVIHVLVITTCVLENVRYLVFSILECRVVTSG